MFRLPLIPSFLFLFFTSSFKLYSQQEISSLPLYRLNRDSLNMEIHKKEKEGKFKELGELYGSLYIYFYHQTQYRDSATIYAFKSEENSLKAGDSARYYFTQVQLGELSEKASDLENAMIRYQKALNYYILTNNYKMLFHVYGAISGIYENKRDTSNSSKYLVLAIEANKKGKDTLGEVILNDIRAQNLIKQNNIDESLELFHKNIWLINNAKIFGNSEEIRFFWRGLQLNMLGECYYRKKEYQTAIKYLMEAQHYDNQTEELSAQNMVRSRLLSKIYLNINKNDSAVKYLDIFYKQAVQTIEKLDPEKLNEISAKYETEKRQREITELKLTNHLQQLTVLNQRKLNIAFALVLFLAIMSAYLIVKNIRQKRKIALGLAKQELLHKEQLYKQNELEIRNKISRDLHDDVGATLSSVKAYSEMLKDNPNNPVIAELIQNNSTEMIERLEVIAWATNPEHDNFKSLKSKMQKFAMPVCHSQNIQCDFESTGINEELLMPGETRQNIFLVFKEAINNMIKYSAATICKTEISIRNNQFILQIKDNGKGVDGNTESDGNGWKNMKKRSEELNGTIEIKTTTGNGTCIIMSIPYPFKIPNTWDRNKR